MAELTLIDVPGVGGATARQLAEHGIGTVAELADASLERLAAVPGFRLGRAETVREAAQRLLESAAAASGGEDGSDLDAGIDSFSEIEESGGEKKEKDGKKSKGKKKGKDGKKSKGEKKGKDGKKSKGEKKGKDGKKSKGEKKGKDGKKSKGKRKSKGS